MGLFWKESIAGHKQYMSKRKVQSPAPGAEHFHSQEHAGSGLVGKQL